VPITSVLCRKCGRDCYDAAVSWLWLLNIVWAQTPGHASLHVGVHRAAGSVHDVAADGAAGQCTVTGPAHVTCPAAGPVTFRWGPDGPWEMTGQTVVAPGEQGVAFVLAPDDARLEERARLHDKWVNAGIIHELFVTNGDNRPVVASRGMYNDLFGLADSSDPAVRGAMIDAMVPLMRRTSSDPLPRTAPPLVPKGMLWQLSKDRDAGVKRRLGRLIREVRPEGGLDREAGEALLVLMVDANSSVRRLALAVAAKASRDELLPVEETWAMAMDRVVERKGPGQAAAGSLARLSKVAEPNDIIQPERAVLATLQYHPEKCWLVWSAWRKHVPFNESWAVHLFRTTEGLNRALLLHWERENPDRLAEVIEEWEPSAPHSRRFELAQTYLARTKHETVRRALDLDIPSDNLSEGVEGTGGG
jgi:hypothetical protein